MEDLKDGEVKFGPLIDNRDEELCSTARRTRMTKSPILIEASTSHSPVDSRDETVDQVLKDMPQKGENESSSSPWVFPM